MKFDIEKLHAVVKPFYGGKMDEKNQYDIGVLSLDKEAIKFVCDFDYIFANGTPIITTVNDRWSAINAFDQAMIGAYGDAYRSFLPQEKWIKLKKK